MKKIGKRRAPLQQVLLSGFLAFAGSIERANAYEITTHGLVTFESYRRSVLNPQNKNTIVDELGFDRLDPEFSFRDRYFDNDSSSSSPQLYTRFEQEEELSVIRGLLDAGRMPGIQSAQAFRQSIPGWLIRGVVREDDNEVNVPVLGWQVFGNFDQDPWGHLFRAPAHFYDPIYDRAFLYRDICEEYSCVKTIEWALGTTTPLDPANEVENFDRRNHFSWVDANRNYWLALTARRDYNGGGYGGFLDRDLSSLERSDRWATTISSIGHVIHLLQDAAQPQHTRNDAHAPPRAAFGPENDSNGAYEAYTDFRVTNNTKVAHGTSNNPMRHMDESLPTLASLTPPVLGNYPKVSFATPARYFTTRHIEIGFVNSRRGMADFSNRNFFTQGTYPGYRECDPPGTFCSVAGRPITYEFPESVNNTGIYAVTEIGAPERIGGRTVVVREYSRLARDSVAPEYVDHLDPAQQGKIPIIARSIFSNWPGSAPQEIRSALRYSNFVANADVLLPRAVAYSAGLIDHFFRGRLEVLPPETRVVGVLNHGAAHTMNAFGYPCAGTSASDGCVLFGFEKIRVKVRNATAAIVESGTGQTVAQNTGGAGAQLVAIARYHRNTCYKPDLSGERVQHYAAPPALVITEPVCGAGQVVRTEYNEIAVSASLTVAAGELDNLAAGIGVEKLFDFSADPIPVNATDLFIQVAYRGPMGDAAVAVDRDVIAVGLLDVREPTFVSFWNNTDYFWNGTAWMGHNGAYPNRGIRDFWVCSGGFPVKLVYQYDGAIAAPAMIDPVSGANVPGQVRLGFVFPPPDAGFPNQRNSVRGTPVSFSSPRVPVRTGVTGGQFRQANKEVVAPATVSAPYLNCATQLPSAPEYWCADPVQQRRGQRVGAVAQPLYLEQVTGSGATDVDATPLPPFAGNVLLAAGTVRFNTDITLANCPAQPGSVPADLQQLRLIELGEEAAELGISIH